MHVIVVSSHLILPVAKTMHYATSAPASAVDSRAPSNGQPRRCIVASVTQLLFDSSKHCCTLFGVLFIRIAKNGSYYHDHDNST